MASMNKVFLMGNLTRDPELRQMPGGMAFCSFGMAINRQFQSARGETREETCFVDIETWGRTAEIVAQYMRKGRPIFVEGRLRFDQWDDRETGKKRNRLTVRAERVQFVDSNPQGGQQNVGYVQDDSYGQPVPQPRYDQPRQPAPAYSQPRYDAPQQNGGYGQQGGYVPAQQPVNQPPASMPAFEGLPEPAAGDDIPF